jgi:hypothetical protein
MEGIQSFIASLLRHLATRVGGVQVRPIWKDRAFWVILIFVLILFYKPIVGGYTFYYRDLYLLFLPQKMRWAQWVRSGEWPLWDPYVQGGQPFWPNAVHMTFYPSQILYLFLPPMDAFNIEIVGHVLLAAIGAY